MKGWAIGRHYYIGGWQGEIIYTSDGGNAWFNQESGVTEDLFSIHLVNESRGWIAGDSGLILAADNGGITSVYSGLNDEFIWVFELKQNYPNPFNPGTNIKYSIPSVTLRQAQSDILVTLKVYDVLGKEVATLLNEEKPAGEYEVEFNAVINSGEVRNLPGGIYFYQLKSGQYSETKKIVLLR